MTAMRRVLLHSIGYTTSVGFADLTTQGKFEVDSSFQLLHFAVVMDCNLSKLLKLRFGLMCYAYIQCPEPLLD